MRNIIRLIQKYSNFILFLILQVISISMVFNWRNSYHHSAYLSSSNHLFAQIYDFKSKVVEYFHLSEINEQLKKENEKLNLKLFNQEITIGKGFIKVDDTIYKQQYNVISSKVINSKFKFKENYVTLNKGKLSGVGLNMGVVGTKGILGIIISISPYYSTVLPVINPKFELAVRHSNTRNFGILKWVDITNSWTTAVVEDVPVYVDVNKGEYFETSGSDGIFPEGIKIGTVLRKEKIQDSQFQRIYVLLIEDFSQVQNAYVIKNTLYDELNKLQREDHD